MAGFSRMDEHSRRSSGSECGGNLASDMTALAHAHDNHPTADTQHHLDGVRKRLIKMLLQTKHSGSLDVQCLARQSNGLLCLTVSGRGVLACHAFIL